MSETGGDDLVEARAAGLFAENRRRVWRQTDRLFGTLLLVQWAAAVALAVWASPRAWAGAESRVHEHVWTALILGGWIAGLPAAVAYLRPGSARTRYLMAAAQMLMGSLLIHLMGGRIETHFHVFGSLALLAFYRDWRVVVLGTAVALAGHLARGELWPRSIFGTTTIEPWRWLEHAGWMLFENLFLIPNCLRGTAEMRIVALRLAELEAIGGRVQTTVLERTAELRVAEDNFLQIFENAAEGIFQKAPDGRYLRVNPALARLFGYDSPATMVAEPADAGPRLFLDPPRREGYAQAIDARGSVEGFESRAVRLDGREIWIRENTRAVRSASGRLLYYEGTVEDVTDRHAAEEALAMSERRFRLLVDNAADAFFLLDEAGRICDVNRRACDSLGYRRDELLRMGVDEIDEEFNMAKLKALMSRLTPSAAATVEGRHLRRDGTNFPVEIRVATIGAGDQRMYLALARDVTERTQAKARLEYQATHDALTGLPNREMLREWTDRAVADARANGGVAALLLIDLDRFKEINDTFGHHHGDLLLQGMSPRFRDAARASDLVARLGGDEFAVLMPGAGRDEAILVARRMLGVGRRPVEVEGRRLEVGMSIGIALFPEHGADSNMLLRRADAAMYSAKQAHTGLWVFDPGRAQVDPPQAGLAAELRRAIEGGELELHYQPKIDLATGRLRGAEALVRWRHPEEGLIPPDRFIPLAEQTGLIRPLGLWVLKEVARQVVSWQESGHDLAIALNLSAQNLQDPEFRESLTTLLADPRLSPRWLGVEITEGAMMAEPDRAKAVLRWLHEAGITVSIDDFGTGYSSLAYLKDLPIDKVKIDRSFLKDMITDAKSACITRATIDLGHNLGLPVVAEGVEDAATESLLASWSCDMAQGYLYSRPLPAAEFLEWVEARALSPHHALRGPHRPIKLLREP